MENTTPTQPETPPTKKRPSGYTRTKKQEEFAAKVNNNKKQPPVNANNINLLGMYRDSEGWKNIELTLSPDMTVVLDVQVSDGPSPRNIVFDHFKIQAFKTFMKE
jgi:hypothetical protein